tara:strand:- start:253 stop:495 length:243 start_codon:yes stop_codon:yes gene_type:complete
MKEISRWVSEKEASNILGVDEKFLETLREEGYLKPGCHWRSANDPEQLPWKPKVFYCLSWCREAIEKLKNGEVLIGQIAA